MDKPITIAVDGHSSTGKSTMAKALAKALNYNYIDTGAMYRSVALFALQNNFFDTNAVLNEQDLTNALDAIKIRFNTRNEVMLNGKVVEGLIRKMEVSSKVSKVAKIAEVRQKLVAEQRAMGKQGGIVMDGRDIGSVVFPNAELKIFMTAVPEVRAKRRQQELVEKGETVTYETVLSNIKERDEMDSMREESPLIKTDDALVLDNSEISRAEQLNIAVHWAKERNA